MPMRFGGIPNPWNQQFNNLFKNGSFESWSAGAAAVPDGWTLAGAGITAVREATIIRFGEYSAKVTRNGTDGQILQDAIAIIDADTETYWRGRTVTMGCWVCATVAGRARLLFNDGVVNTYSSYHTGSSSWEFLVITATLDAVATRLRLHLRVDTGDTDAYFDGAIFIEGTICPTFVPKPVEHVAGWQDWTPTITDEADLSGYNMARFCLYGKTCFFTFDATTKNITTAGALRVTLPFTVANLGSYQMITGTVYDGTAHVGFTNMEIVPNTNYFRLFKTAARGNWAGTENNVNIRVGGFYEIA